MHEKSHLNFAFTFVCNFECAHCGANIDNSKTYLNI